MKDQVFLLRRVAAALVVAVLAWSAGVRATAPVDCPGSMAELLARRHASYRDAALEATRRLEANEPERQALEAGHAELSSAVVREYQRAGHFTSESLATLRRQAETLLTGRGIAPDRAAQLARDWVARLTETVDVRFPLVDLPFQAPAGYAEAVRDAMAIVNNQNAMNVDHARRKIQGQIEIFGNLKSPVAQRRIAELQRHLARLDEFQRLNTEVQQLYDRIPSAQGRGFPYGFRSREQWLAFSRDFRSEIRRSLRENVREMLGRDRGLLDADSAQIRFFLGGSAVDGLSFGYKIGDQAMRRPFGEHIDLDISIVLPNNVFEAMQRRGAISLDRHDEERSVPYSRDRAPEHLRERLALLEPLLRLQEGLPVEKVSISFVSERFFTARQRIRNFMELPQ